MIQIRMFGCKVELSFLFVAVTACSVLLDHTGCVIHTLLASFFHECGHLAAMGFLGGAPKKVTFGIFHIDIQDNRRVKRGYYQDILILLAGPIVNLVLCLLLLIGFGVFHQQIFLFAASTNLLIGFFNLLPVESLDGGQIVKENHWSRHRNGSKSFPFWCCFLSPAWVFLFCSAQNIIFLYF